MTRHDVEGGARMRVRIGLAFTLLVGAVLTLTACGGSSTDIPGVDPARTEQIPGSAAKRVVFSEDATNRLGIETVPVRATGGAGPGVEIPYLAVLYDPDGATWTYTSPSPRSYVRSDIRVASVVGDRAILSKGPPVGTEVVTVGSAEIWGVEYGEIEED